MPINFESAAQSERGPWKRGELACPWKAIRQRAGMPEVNLTKRNVSKGPPIATNTTPMPHDGVERDRRADPSESPTDDPNNRRRARRLDAVTVGRGKGAAAAPA
jgi:hypothetical protein